MAELLYAMDCWNQRMDSRVKFLCQGLDKKLERFLFRKAPVYSDAVLRARTSDVAQVEPACLF